MPREETIANTVAILNRVKGYAEQKNVTLCMEITNSKVAADQRTDQTFNRLDWGWEVCRKVASPRVKIVYDIYHVQIMDGDVVRNLRDNLDWICHIHVAGVPSRQEIDGTQELNYRFIADAIPVATARWRRDGEPHLFNPETVFRLQHATRERRYDIFKAYTRGVDDQSENLMTLRGLLKFKAGVRPAVPLEEVESVSSIVKRFSTGAMSYGSISKEAHETLAIAMNRLGGKSNTGEGGEDVDRLLDPARRSAVKQIASGRFGVTSLYLTNADDIQIKMAQGAKPGEGGQLMAQKVYPWVARTRHSTPGVGLISPPPHHDIYSIEDLAQLIYDAKRANPSARVHVKLVSEVGIGTVAAGVTKAKADVVLVSGHDGGTGASPLNSLKHAGVPVGTRPRRDPADADAQRPARPRGGAGRRPAQDRPRRRDRRAARRRGVRFRHRPAGGLRLHHDARLPPGHLSGGRRDAEPGAALPVQRPGRVRGQLLRIPRRGGPRDPRRAGFRSIEEAIGHAEMLDTRDAINHWKAEGLDLDPILGPGSKRRAAPTDHGPEPRTRQALRPAPDRHGRRPWRPQPVTIAVDVINTDRSVGTMLGHVVTKTFSTDVLATDTIDITLHGTAGQSLGAFLPAGITLRMFGDSNDYVGKGLSGGRIIVRPDRTNVFPAERNVIAGNVIGYGATSGEMFLRGQVGERFLVRNSGATAVVEGIGDHGCEYMTGGQTLIIGRTGRNFGAGMSGGTAYVLDLQTERVNKQALETAS